jgi:hypothetical protein
MRGAGREVHEKRLVGHQRSLLAHPLDRLIGHVFGEVVALFRRLGDLDGRCAFVDSRVVLVGFAADEAVEVFESAAARWPLVEWSHGAGLPDRNFVTFAELRCGVTVELQYLGERCFVFRQNRVVTGGGGGDLTNAAHVHRMMITPGEHRLTCRRTQCRGVEAVIFQSACRQPLCCRCADGTAEGTGGRKTHVVEQNDQDIGRSLGRPQRLDGRKFCVRIFGIVGCQTDVLAIGYR